MNFSRFYFPESVVIKLLFRFGNIYGNQSTLCCRPMGRMSDAVVENTLPVASDPTKDYQKQLSLQTRRPA